MLTICGDGPERKMLEEKAKGLGIAEKVTFTGKLDPPGIAAQLKNADIYVSTAESDSTSVSLLEAMACGAVPVVTDLEANREWIRDGVSGALFRPGDHTTLAGAVLALADDAGKAGSMRTEAAAIVGKRGLWLPNMERAESEFSRLAGKGTDGK
jgi:glycosyltransferase involved in cell wall biosynthesis